MIKRSKIRRQHVEVRPSRIRRQPVPVENAVARRLSTVDWNSREWEIRLAIGGILFFALALSAVVIDIGELLSR